VEARRPSLDRGVRARASGFHVSERLERQTLTLFLQRHEGGDCLLHDPPLRAIEPLGEAI
jgi:hypothetical protein